MKKILSAFLALLVIISFTSCGDKKLLTISFDINSEPQNLDPQTASDKASLNIINNVFEGLVLLDKDEKIQNGIATGYTVDSTKTIYNFKLRQDAKWITYNDNEKPLTAKDFVFAFKRLFMEQTNSPSASLYFCIKNSKSAFDGKVDINEIGVVAINDYELEIKLDYPNDNFLYLLTQSGAMPCNEEFFVQTKGKYGLGVDTIMSNGAFMLAKWTHKFSARLERNTSYYAQSSVAVERVSLYIETKSSSDKELEKEKNITIDNTVKRLLDGTSTATIIDGFKMKEIASKGFNSEPFESGTWGVAFNFNNPQLANKNVRLSIAKVFDRSSYEGYLPESLVVANAIVPNSVTLSSQTYRNFAGENITQRLDKTGAFADLSNGLDELGQKKISGLRLLVPKNEDARFSEHFMYVSQIIQRELGIFIGIDEVPQDEYKSKLASGDFDIAIMNLPLVGNSPETILEQFESTQNNFGYANKSVDTDILNAKIQVDEIASANYYKSAEKAIIDDVAFIPMYYKTDYFVTSQSISGITLNSRTGLISFKYAVKSK